MDGTEIPTRRRNVVGLVAIWAAAVVGADLVGVFLGLPYCIAVACFCAVSATMVVRAILNDGNGNSPTPGIVAALIAPFALTPGAALLGKEAASRVPPVVLASGYLLLAAQACIIALVCLRVGWKRAAK